jgi:hypothetical protein
VKCAGTISASYLRAARAAANEFCQWKNNREPEPVQDSMRFNRQRLALAPCPRSSEQIRWLNTDYFANPSKGYSSMSPDL